MQCIRPFFATGDQVMPAANRVWRVTPAAEPFETLAVQVRFRPRARTFER
jgi:hypothetical protein